MDTKKRTMLACSMMEDEVNHALAQYDGEITVIWMDRALHRVPENLKIELQKEIDNLQDQDEILMVYGLCGNGCEGLVSEKATLVFPRFDDCVNMMLCTKNRRTRGLVEAGKMYFTGGWTKDDEAVLQQFEKYSEEYDEETAEDMMDMLFGSYNNITLINNGCYEIEPIRAYAKQAMELLDFDSYEEIERSNFILEQLVRGEYDENFIVLPAGEALTYGHFNLVTNKERFANL